MFPAPALPETAAKLPLSCPPPQLGLIAGGAGPAVAATAAITARETSATLIPLLYVNGDAASEPRDTARRPGRRSGARPRLRQPGLPARQERPDRALVRGQALDLVPARLQGLAARPDDAAGQVHGALLPRRGDGVRRRSPPVRALPPSRLQPLPHAHRRIRRRRDRRATARRAPRRARSAPARRSARRPARRRVRPARRRAVARACRRARPLDAGRLHGARRATRQRSAGHSTDARRGAALRLAGARAPPPPLCGL